MTVSTLAVDYDCGVLRHAAQDVRLDFVLFLLGVVARRFPARVAPRFLDDAVLTEKVGAFKRALLVGGSEYETVAEVQREDARLFSAKRRDE